MKKTFLLGLILAVIFGFNSINKVFADENSEIIKKAIEKYKQNNYIGCISDLKLYNENDYSNAVSWYYLANSYMNIGMNEEAHAAFERVISLNTVPQLTSYSIQAEICMENPDKCKYQNFNNDQISKLRANPMEFLNEYFANLNASNKDAEIKEIENLINGSYYNNIHPSAQEFIKKEKVKMKETEINSNSAYLPSDDKLSQALNILQNQNKEISSFAMLMDTPEQAQDSNYAEIVRKYYGSDSNKTVTPEMVQLMMMQNMFPTF